MPGKQEAYMGFVEKDIVLPAHLSQYYITNIYYRIPFYKIIPVFINLSETHVCVFTKRYRYLLRKYILGAYYDYFKVVALKVMYFFLLCLFLLYLNF